MTRAREAARLIGNNTFRLDSNNAVGFNSTTPDAMFDINHGLIVAGVSTFSGNVTMSGDLTVQGTTTTLDTNLQEVDLINVQANASVPAIGVTQSGSGNIISAYDGTSEVFSVADGGNVGVSDKIIHLGDTNTAIRFPAADTFTVETSGSEALRVDSSGRMLVKLASSIASEPGEGHTPALQVAHVGGNVTNLGISVSRFQASNPNSVPIILQKSRNDTVGSHTIVQDDDELGRLEFAGSDGSNFRTAAAITGEVDGTPGSSDMPGRLEFKTTADGATSPTERLRITAAGNVSIQNDSGKFTAGAGDDLQIYHDGSQSYIAGDDIRITNNAVSETIAKFLANGAVELNHNDSKKFETTSTGVTVTGDVNSTSDIDLKKDIEVVTSATEMLNQLRGVKFAWKENDEKSVGVIAQEVEAILPELVKGEEGDKSVNYSGLVGVLIEAVKELSARVEELENK